MTDEAPDNPGVIIMPPLLLLIIILSGLVLDWLAPLGLLSRLPLIARGITGAILMVLGIGLAAGGGPASSLQAPMSNRICRPPCWSPPAPLSGFATPCMWAGQSHLSPLR
jgi:hypothetical protein